MDVHTTGVIFQEQLKIGIKLLFSANRKSHMPRRLALQRMTLSDLEMAVSVSTVAELLVTYH